MMRTAEPRRPSGASVHPHADTLNSTGQKLPRPLSAPNRLRGFITAFPRPVANGAVPALCRHSAMVPGQLPFRPVADA